MVSKKIRITMEEIADNGTLVTLCSIEFDRSEVKWSVKNDIEPRYEEGNYRPVGVWNYGYSLNISAAHKRKTPIEI